MAFINVFSALFKICISNAHYSHILSAPMYVYVCLLNNIDTAATESGVITFDTYNVMLR